MLPDTIIIGLSLVGLFGALTLALAIGGSTEPARRRGGDDLDEVPSTHG